MDTFKVNQFGRSYKSGQSLSEELRRQVIEKILAEGGDRFTGFIPTTYAYLSRELKLALNTVKSIWRTFCQNYTVAPKLLVA